MAHTEEFQKLCFLEQWGNPFFVRRGGDVNLEGENGLLSVRRSACCNEFVWYQNALRNVEEIGAELQ